MSTYVCDVPHVDAGNHGRYQPEVVEVVTVEPLRTRDLVGSVIVFLSGAIALAAAVVSHL